MATEGEQDFEEDLLIEQMPIEEEWKETEDTQQQEGEEQPTALPPLPPPPEVHISIEDAVFMALKVGALKNELKTRGQSSTGKKTDLQERLKIVLTKKLLVLNLTINKNVMPNKVKKKVETPKGMKAFPISAYWRVLQPKSEAVVEPTNPSFKLARAPKIAEQDAEFVPIKYDFE